jgi:hypothetical protein
MLFSKYYIPFKLPTTIYQQQYWLLILLCFISCSKYGFFTDFMDLVIFLSSSTSLSLSSSSSSSSSWSSTRCLCYEKTKDSSTANSPDSAIQRFYFFLPVYFLLLKVIQHPFTSSSSSSCQFYTFLHLSFNNVFQKAVLLQGVTKHNVCVVQHTNHVFQ